MAKQVWRAGNMLYPVPAVMVSCAREGEKPNIITVAWAGTICSEPAMVSISVRKQRYSHEIISQTKEFVINLTTKELCRATDYCGVRSGRDVDKFKEMHLTPTESVKVHAPGIKESPVNIECKVKKIVPLGTHDMFIAEVVAVVIEDTYLNENNRFELNKAGLVTYSHGEYFELGKYIGKFGYSVAKHSAKGKAQKSNHKGASAHHTNAEHKFSKDQKDNRKHKFSKDQKDNREHKYKKFRKTKKA